MAGPRRLIATYAETENPLPLEEVHRDLALHMEDSYDANAVRLQRLVVALRLGSLFLAGEVLAWVVAIAVGG